MYSDFFIIDKPGQPPRQATKLTLGDTLGRDEKWLRDLLFAQPGLLPIADIDTSFGPLLPLCKELRTEAGPLDIAFINQHGLLTLVECKLWRNPESRRKVVAQTLHYASAISNWSYSDLQRKVSQALGRQGNLPFQIAYAADNTVRENSFVDAVSRNIKRGKFLLLIVGDGIREDLSTLAGLINRNAASGFSFGLVEVGLYDLMEEGLAVQPRVVAKTHLIERHIVIIRNHDVVEVEDPSSQAPIPSEIQAPNEALSEVGSASNDKLARQERYRAWWKSVTEMTFDDPDQDPPKLFWINHVRVQLPLPGIWITAYCNEHGVGKCGVFLTGRKNEVENLIEALAEQRDAIASELPPGTNASQGFDTIRQNTDFQTDDERRIWLKEVLNSYVNAFRPRIRQ